MNVTRRGKSGLRADNKLDVSSLAYDLAEGGGHPNASGLAFDDWKDKVLYKDVKEYIDKKLDLLST